jgi:hypothetical protein
MDTLRTNRDGTLSYTPKSVVFFIFTTAKEKKKEVSNISIVKYK